MARAGGSVPCTCVLQGPGAASMSQVFPFLPGILRKNSCWPWWWQELTLFSGSMAQLYPFHQFSLCRKAAASVLSSFPMSIL